MNKYFLTLSLLIVFCHNVEASDDFIDLYPPFIPSCFTDQLNQGVIGFVDILGKSIYVRRFATIFDQALDDFGSSASGDEVEVFCVSRSENAKWGFIVMCLSGEKCPWRGEGITVEYPL